MLSEGSNASTVLTWVRPDLDKHLDQVRSRLEHLAEAAYIGDGIKDAVDHLTTLKHTFEALVLQGATLVVEEMIAVCDELENPDAQDRQKIFGTLMDAVVVLPSYLDRLQAGHHDLPVLLLPIINELRAAHNANIVSEATLFAPNLDIPLPDLERDKDEHHMAADETLQAFILRVRRQWETALLRWLQNQDDVQSLSPLHSVCEALQRRLERQDLRRLWWIAGEVIGGLLDGVTDNDVNLRRLFARLNLTIKTLAEGGEEAADTQSVDSISQALLFHIAQARTGNAGVDNLRERFRLQELVPDRDILIRARGSITGRNRDLYISLGAAVRDELALVKDALDLELRTGEITPDSRGQIHESLLRLKDTLKMMGLGDTALSVENLIPALDASAAREHAPGHRTRESLLMDLASKLIQVESVLEEQIATLGEPLQEDQDPGYIDLPLHEQRRIHTHLLDETVSSLHQVQDGVRKHLNGDQHADYTNPMEHIAGAMELIGEPETASLTLKLRNALGNLLRITRAESNLETGKLEAVADAVAALELYLAGCRDQQSNRGQFLDILRDRLEQLPVGEIEVVETISQTPEPDAKALEDPIAVESADAGLLPPAIDSELLDVFLEEFDTVIAMFTEQLPRWMQQQHDIPLVTEIRRGFHTLKGSGRMVGADEIGDFAWHIEEMLNTLLEGNIDSVDDVTTITRLSEAMLPAMKERLLQQPSELTVAAIEAISQQADQVAKDEAPDWTVLSNTLPASMVGLLPAGITRVTGPEDESTPEIGEHAEPAPVEPESRGLADNLQVLKGLMDRILKDRNHAASDEEILAVSTLAATENPLGREHEMARALQDFLEVQRSGEKPFSDTAIWRVATCLSYFETCLAILDGESEAELASDADTQIDQLNALTTEYRPVEESHEEIAREHEAVEDLVVAPDEVPVEQPHEEIADEPEAAEELTVTQDELPAEVSAQGEEPGTETEEPAEPESEPVDPEILGIFLEEATDILERCDSLLNNWRDNLSDLSIVQNLQREIHTFKGGSRMAGVSALGNLSHSMETLLEQIAGRLLPPSVSAIEVLEQGCDRLNTWTEQASRGILPQAGDALELFEQQVEALTAPAETVTPEPEEAEPVETEPVETEPVEAESVETESVEAEPVESDVSTTDTEATPEDTASVVTTAADSEETEAKPEPLQEIPDVVVPASEPDVREEPRKESAASQHIRVNADLLDSLVNSAGEISIYRSRLEQQVAYMRENLKEFDQTVSRLRGQFRKLEIETETQIRSRYQPEVPDGSDEFDPLEMDRFSSMQQLSRSLSESVSDLLNLQELLDTSARRSEALLVQQSRVSSELQEGLMQTRMVHFGNIAPRLRRITRTAANEVGKKARLQLRMTGGGDQLDRNVLERITAPLEHLLRNSIVHGIEKPGQRKKLNKPKEGQLTITVSAEATEFVVRVEDDGAGMDLGAIHQRAIATGLLNEEDKPTPQQLLQFILHSGFSTSKKVTALAGRGVGMDVVNSEIKQIGGSVEIDSEQGKGSCFTIRIPFSLAVMQAIGVVAGERRYLIPVASVAGVARMMPADYQELLENEKPAYEFAGEPYTILELEPLLGEPSTPLGEDTISILMIKAGEQRAAFRVPELLGHQEIVVKPVGPQISSVPGILGGTITGDGQVVIIIDAGPMIRHALFNGARPAPQMENVEVRKQKPLALVVDDSITMRKVTTRVLESDGFEVITARDGVDATEQMQERLPDLLVLDVEMPRMDGYQVAEYVRTDARLRHVPIVMITSRAGEKHRKRGIKAGANAYLSKPYKESELILEVSRLLNRGAE